jgi:beta-phosphoglucomutase-like phosphatase (HAD superfamily)
MIEFEADAVLFDSDGVLIDSDKVVEAGWRHLRRILFQARRVRTGAPSDG